MNDEERKAEDRKQQLIDLAGEVDKAMLHELASLRTRVNNAGKARRDMFAAAAMQGLLSTYQVGTAEHPEPSTVAHDAVVYADALIAALDATSEIA